MSLMCRFQTFPARPLAGGSPRRRFALVGVIQQGGDPTAWDIKADVRGGAATFATPRPRFSAQPAATPPAQGCLLEAAALNQLESCVNRFCPLTLATAFRSR